MFNNNQYLGISLDERKSRAYQVVHPMWLWGWNQIVLNKIFDYKISIKDIII